MLKNFAQLQVNSQKLLIFENAWSKKNTCQRSVQNQDKCITLMTLHSAKARISNCFYDWYGRVYFIANLTDTSGVEEERRLCYVGITRAEKQLYMTYTQADSTLVPVPKSPVPFCP